MECASEQRGALSEAVQGDIFGDGSCTRRLVKELNRAGWAFTVWDRSTGLEVVRVRGPVWGPVPQTPQAAEFHAYSVALQWSVGPTNLFLDCQNCVDFHSLPFPAQCAPKRIFAGVAQFCRIFSHQCSVSKVKAHQVETDGEDAWTRYLREGNSAVDRSAKLAVELHPEFDREAVERLDEQCRVSLAVVVLAAKLVPSWPKLDMGPNVVRNHP